MKNFLSLRLAAIAAAAFTLVFAAGCSTAKVQDTWTAPDVTQLNFKKILVISATQDGSARRIAEDAVAAASPGVEVVPSYRVIPDVSDLKNLDKVSETINAAHFDGVVVMRMLSSRDKVTVTQDPGFAGYPVGYRTFRGYYGRYALGGYGYRYGYGRDFGATTTVTTDRITQIETNIYEMPGGKLVWSATTESTSPDSTQQLVDDVVAALKKELIKDKLIPATKS